MPCKGFLFTCILFSFVLVAKAQDRYGAPPKPKSKIIVAVDSTVQPDKNNLSQLATSSQNNLVIKTGTVPEKSTDKLPVSISQNKTIHNAEVLAAQEKNTAKSASATAQCKTTGKPETLAAAEKGTAKPSASSIKASVTPSKCKVPNLKESDLKGGYKTIPLVGQKSYYGEMNEFAFNFTKQYLSAHNKTFNAVQERGEKSFPVMETELKRHNIPQELKYLAVIESALNNKAVSRAGAVGPWQLMSSTARLMGLSVNRKRDDRKDWNRSTNAAAKYLSILYDQLNDWLLVIAAYNSGPSPVQRAIERTGSHNFWEIKPYLPRETQGHVLAFIATASIFENLNNFISLGEIPEDLKLDKDGKPIAEVILPKPAVEKETEKASQSKSPFTMEELQKMSIVSITEPLSMELLANELSIDLKLLNKWNPDYQLFVYNSYPTKDYKLRIPKDKLDNFVQKKQFIEKKSKQIFNDQKM